MQVHYRAGTGNFGKFSPHFILCINFRGGHISGGARAIVASPSLAPLVIAIVADTTDKRSNYLLASR